MRVRDWSADAAGQFDAAVRGSFGVWRIAVRGERRAVIQALEPTERVLAVAVCGYEIVRHEAVAGRSMAALVAVTDRRVIFAQKVPLRPARRVEVTRRELRDGAVEVDASERRVAVAAGAIRITMRPVMGRDAVVAVATSIGVPYPGAPDEDAREEDEAPGTSLPPPEPPQPLGPGSRLTLVPLIAPGAYCVHQNDRVVASILRLRNGSVHVSRAGRRWQLRVRHVRGGWIGVAEEERSGEQVASYRVRPVWGGTLTLEGRAYRLRRGVTGAWRLRDGRTDVAVMRGGDPSGDVELAAGITQVADPILLVVMIVWATWLEGEFATL